MFRYLPKHLLSIFALLIGLSAVTLLAACSTPGLPVGLSARMDAPGASLDRAEALSLINLYRRSRNVPAVQGDASLDAIAQALATQYATSGSAPQKPDEGIDHMRVSAGYANFAETFSGWRSSPADANIIADPSVTNMGLGVAYAPNSTYGVHWVLLLASPSAPPAQIAAPIAQ